MTDETNLLKILTNYKNSLTWEFDREATTKWILSIQKAMMKAKLLDMDPIKQFIALKEIKVRECDLDLLNNRNLSDDERKRIFDKRDILKADIEFFTEAGKIVQSAKVEAEKLKEEKQNAL